MLSPEARALYTEALTPPPGYVFGLALATTYSLDPATLLTVPVHFALLGRSSGEVPRPVELLESLQRVADRTTVYAQRGRMAAPRGQQALYGLLESMVCEVASPGGGAFHPKLWVLRFDVPGAGRSLLRVLVLSRNLTADRSWDLCLRLEGEPGAHAVAGNGPLATLLRGLPDWARSAPSDERRAQAQKLANLLERTPLSPPEGFDDLRFHVITRQPWLPAPSKRLAVVSPFVTRPALEALVGTTRRAVALVSRPETLDALDWNPGAKFAAVYALDDAAQTEEDEEALDHDMAGLHAKVILTEEGRVVRLYVGSANTTTSALIAGQNVEVLVELSGRRGKALGIDALLGEGGLQGYLATWQPPAMPVPETQAQRLAEQALETARQALAAAHLVVTCEETGEGWRMRLEPDTPIPLAGLRSVVAWPITVRDQHALDAAGLADGEAADLGVFPTASVTGLIGFELIAAAEPLELRFTLNLPLTNPPADRLGALLRAVLDSREGFLRYLLLLLGDFDADASVLSGVAADDSVSMDWRRAAEGDMPLLEEMVRAFSRDPVRLGKVRRVVSELRRGEHADDVVPLEFQALWAIFEAAMGEVES